MGITGVFCLTHWGRVTHICISKLTIISSDNGLSPDQRQAIIWTNAGLLLIGPLGTNFSEILIEILTFSFMKMRLKVSSAKRRPFCLGLNVLKPEQCLSIVVDILHAVSCYIGLQYQMSKVFNIERLQEFWCLASLILIGSPVDYEAGLCLHDYVIAGIMMVYNPIRAEWNMLMYAMVVI